MLLYRRRYMHIYVYMYICIRIEIERRQGRPPNMHIYSLLLSSAHNYRVCIISTQYLYIKYVFDLFLDQ